MAKNFAGPFLYLFRLSKGINFPQRMSGGSVQRAASLYFRLAWGCQERFEYGHESVHLKVQSDRESVS